MVCWQSVAFLLLLMALLLVLVKILVWGRGEGR